MDIKLQNLAPLDHIDIQMLKILSREGRLPVTEIAAASGHQRPHARHV